MDISLIGVPIMYGCDRQGVQFGPDKLRRKGILDVIRKYNSNTYDLGNLYIPEVKEEDKYAFHKKIKYSEAIKEVNTNLAHLVYSVLKSNSFPFVIGGDHSLGLGSISGASRFFDELAVIWIDAHGDINTHETSPSHNFHGMPLGSSMGIGEPIFTNLYFDGSKAKPENVFLIGVRDLDEGEVEIARDLDLNLYSMDTVKERGIDNVIEEVIDKIKSSKVDAVHLSFDIDVLDKELVPGTGTPVADGFSLEEGKRVLEKLLSTGMIKSMDLVEYNPYLDEGDITANNCIELVDCIFKTLGKSQKIAALV